MCAQVVEDSVGRRRVSSLKWRGKVSFKQLTAAVEVCSSARLISLCSFRLRVAQRKTPFPFFFIFSIIFSIYIYTFLLPCWDFIRRMSPLDKKTRQQQQQNHKMRRLAVARSIAFWRQCSTRRKEFKKYLLTIDKRRGSRTYRTVSHVFTLWILISCCMRAWMDVNARPCRRTNAASERTRLRAQRCTSCFSLSILLFCFLVRSRRPIPESDLVGMLVIPCGHFFFLFPAPLLSSVLPKSFVSIAVRHTHRKKKKKKKKRKITNKIKIKKKKRITQELLIKRNFLRGWKKIRSWCSSHVRLGKSSASQYETTIQRFSLAD